MIACACREPHDRRRIVLTGGPGAGKTAVLELIRQSFCVHIKVLPEAASIVFGGGFPRDEILGHRQASQRAIFYVQRELESAAESDNLAITLCDRGTIDGAAYWPGQGDLWASVGTTLEEQLARYDAVIHLRTPKAGDGYNHQNPLRVESATEAAAIDALILQTWEKHPRRFIVEPSLDFIAKASRTIDLLRREMPECCRHHLVPLLGEIPRDSGTK
ncbi:MAG: ATP-binding protein [Nitrospirota bacterium]